MINGFGMLRATDMRFERCPLSIPSAAVIVFRSNPRSSRLYANKARSINDRSSRSRFSFPCATTSLGIRQCSYDCSDRNAQPRSGPQASMAIGNLIRPRVSGLGLTEDWKLLPVSGMLSTKRSKLKSLRSPILSTMNDASTASAEGR